MAGLVACSSGGGPAPEVVPPPGAGEPASQPPTRAELEALEVELEQSRRSRSEAEADANEMKARLAAKEAELSMMEERYAALEVELAQTLEEVLRAKASIRGVQSRAFATSRISEVRVQLGSANGSSDPEVVSRLERAEEFLGRADRELEKENFGGASYLAERASELVLQARTVGEVRRGSGATGPITPVLPPREMTVKANSNLRGGPGVERERVGGAQEGEKVLAVARAGDWYRVETGSGLVAWILGRLVE